MTETRAALSELVKALERLADTFPGQAEYLDNLGVEDCADELAIEFEDALLVVLPSADELGLSATTLTMLSTLDRLLTAMSGSSNQDLWNRAALENSPRWEEVRQQALRLTAMVKSEAR